MSENRLQLPSATGLTHVLIISHDVVGTQMAGPGIRYWHLARVLSRHCAVTLAAPNAGTFAQDFEMLPYQPGDYRSLRPALRAADVVMPCGDVLSHFPELTNSGRPLVIDGYDPYLAETVALAGNRSAADQAILQANFMDQMRAESLAGDFFLCATERQRYWWMGLLASQGRLNTLTYGADPTLRNLVDTVPFGCIGAKPHTRQVMKGVMPGIGTGDKVVLWGGGIWEWLDPLTLLRAFPQVLQKHPDAKLVFPGTRHPNPGVPDMKMRCRAIDLAREMQLLGTAVFFGDWVPYSDWGNVLHEADVGISLHLDSVEEQLAFRSRILDYVGAGLPIVASGGDATAELVARYGLGEVVRVGDAGAVAMAISSLLDQPREARQAQFNRARDDYAWERVAQPLIHFCCTPYKAADRTPGHVPLRPRAEDALENRISELTRECDTYKREVERQQEIIRGYERGRFITLMRIMRHIRRKVQTQ